MKRIGAIGLILLLSGCQFFQECDSMMPKFQCGLVDFQSLLPQNARDVQRLVSETERFVDRSISRIVNRIGRRCDFKNTILPLDRIGGRAAMVAGIMELMVLVSPDREIREAAAAGLVKIKGLFLEKIGTNRELYKIFKEYATSPERSADQLTEEQVYYLTETIKAFERNGLGLPDDQLAQVRELSHKLMDLESQFEVNISNDVQSIAVTREALDGLDQVFVDSLTRNQQGSDPQGEYLLRVDTPTRDMVLQYCAVAQTREKILTAYNNRAYPVNQQLLERIIALRDKLARELGYKSFAHMNLDGQMGQSPEKITEFLNDLMTRATPKYQRELELFKSELPVGVVLTADGLFRPWDFSYVIESCKRNHLAVDMQKVREYFPVKRTLDELLSIYERFLGLEFRQEETVGLWHSDVKHIVVYKKTGELLGHLLLDLYPRDNKYTHACQITICPAIFDGGVRCPAVIGIIANFPRPDGDNPGLLQLNDVSTFFHEFGHAMHALLGATTMVDFSGTATKTDFVEVPSQMFEEWLSEPAVLKQVSYHYKTGEPLDDETITRLCELKKFSSGAFVTRQVGLAQFALSCFGPGEVKDISAINRQIHTQFSRGVLYDDRTHFYCSFGHLTQYGARYYSYLWSQVFAYDLFAAIKQRGLFDSLVGEQFIAKVLGYGGSREPLRLMRDFLDREPTMEAFLQRLGF